MFQRQVAGLSPRIVGATPLSACRTFYGHCAARGCMADIVGLAMLMLQVLSAGPFATHMRLVPFGPFLA